MQNAVGIAEPDYGVLFADMFYADAIADSVRSLPRAADRGRAGLRAEGAAARARLHAVRRAQRHRLRHARARNPGDAHASRRSRDRRRRARSWTRSPTTPRMPRWCSAAGPSSAGCRPALDRRAAVPQRRGRGDRLAAGVLNHPANGVAWLANRLAPQGEHLAAGEVVLAGSFTRPVDIVRATRFTPITAPSARCRASSSEQQNARERSHDRQRGARASISAASSTPIRFRTPAASAIS